MPDVYFVVGNSIAGGTITHGSAMLIVVGTDYAGWLYNGGDQHSLDGRPAISAIGWVTHRKDIPRSEC